MALGRFTVAADWSGTRSPMLSGTTLCCLSCLNADPLVLQAVAGIIVRRHFSSHIDTVS